MQDTISPAQPAAPSPEVVPPAPPRPSPPRRSGPTPTVVLIIAVALVVVLAVVFLGLSGSGSSGGSSPSAAGSTFSSARNVADRFASEHGRWALFGAIGAALANASYLAYNGSTGNASCIATTIAGTVPTNLTLPAFRGSLTSGGAPFWLFDYWASGVGELSLIEMGGQVPLAVELPARCVGAVANVPGIGTAIVDSSTAVSAAAAAGGSAFLRAHPTGVSLTMAIIGGVLLAGTPAVAPEWSVSWSTCSNTLFNSGAQTSGYEFSAAVNATTGSVVPTSVTNTTCGPGVTSSEGIADAVTFGSVSLSIGSGTGRTIASQGCTSGDYCYKVPVISVSENLTPADFELNVQNFSDGAIVETTVGYAILNASGVVLVYSPGAIETEWTPAAGNPQALLAAGMTIYVDTGPANPTLDNLGLVLTGEGPFANSSMGFTF